MRDPFKIDDKTCISFSGGRTSAYMLWRVLDAHDGKLPSNARVLFANTGKEDRRTLRFVEDCATHWGAPITWVEYATNEVGFTVVRNAYLASEAGQPFAALIEKRKYLPNPVARFCTSDLKIKPISAYLRHNGWGDFDMMVGIRADEPRRAAKMTHLSLPLVRAGVTKDDVLAFWKSQPFDLEAEESNCDLCFLKGFGQIMGSIRRSPEKAIWWAKQEEKIGARFRSDRPSYAEMKANAENQQQLFNSEEAIACFCGD